MIIKICFGIIGLLFLFAHTAFAQIGNCEQSIGEAIIDAGNVRARILNNGSLFWNGSPAVYEVPKGESVNAIFAAGIWIAGLVENELRGSAARYSHWEFWPGPLDDAGNAPANCSMYDKVWEIRESDLTAYFQSQHISQNLKNWPWQLGAPVIDGDGNPNNYNLDGGDLPELLGAQRLWWVMNDRGNTHESTGATPIGLEVQGSVHAFNHPGFAGNSTFYEYTIINKNLNTLKDAYFTFFADVDLGNFDDDYVGSDSLLHLGYVYNSDNDDEGTGGYGIAPPALGVTLLKTAEADENEIDDDRDGETDEPGEMIGASGFMKIGKSAGIYGEPLDIAGYYNYMQSQWIDGSKLTLGGNGYGYSSIPVNFSFSGDPVTFRGWSEIYADPIACSLRGCAIQPADRRFNLSSGPFEINSMDTLVVQFAIVWSRGENHLDSVTALKKDVASLRSFASAFFEPQIVSADAPQPPPATYHLGFDQNFPNPFTASTTLRYSLPQSMRVRLTVYDVLGRQIKLLVNTQQDAGVYTVEFDSEDLPAGLYLARIDLDHLSFTKRMVKAD